MQELAIPSKPEMKDPDSEEIEDIPAAMEAQIAALRGRCAAPLNPERPGARAGPPRSRLR